MNLERLWRWSVPGTLLAGCAFLAAGALVWVYPGSDQQADGVRMPGGPGLYLFEGLVGLGLFGLLTALIGIHRQQIRQTGWLGSVAIWIAFVGTTLVLAGTVQSLGSKALRGDFHVLDGLFFDLALIVWLVGFLLLGLVTLSAKVLPGWVGTLLLGWQVVFAFVTVIFGDASAHATVGLIWLAIGYALWMQERASIGVGPEVSAASGQWGSENR